jgi:hypothetical protein
MTDTALEQILAMVRGSLDLKSELLLEELNLKRARVANRMEWDGMVEKRETSQKNDGQKGTDEPWKRPGQSSQDPRQEPPPKPDHSKRERER